MENIIQWPDPQRIEDEAANWLIRLDGAEALSEEDAAALREWLARSPQHVEALKKLNAFWADNRLTALLAPALESVQPRRKVPRRLLRPLIGAVGVLCVAGLLVLFNIAGQGRGLGTGAGNGLYATAIGQQKSVELTDGTVLELNTNSQLRVAYSDSDRIIHLIQGEVHFNVAEQPARPFRVYARNSRVQAVGTAFTVYLAEREVEVYVTQGRVALAGLHRSDARPDSDAAPDNKNSVVEGDAHSAIQTSVIQTSAIQTLGTLDAGQGTVLTAEHARAQKPLEMISAPQGNDFAKRLAWRDGLLIFSGETLEQVIAQVRRYTPVQIEIATAEIRRIEIAGQIRVGDTVSMFKALESNFGLRVKHLGYNRVQITLR